MIIFYFINKLFQLFKVIELKLPIIVTWYLQVFL